MRTTFLVCAAAVLALGACSKKTETAATGTGSPATATAPEASKPALALTPPARKDGLWLQTMSSDRMNQQTKICIDQTVEQKMKWWSQQAQAKGSDCEKSSVKPRLGGGWEFDASCDMGSGRITSHGVASGDFDSHYTVEIESTTTGSPMPQANGPHKMKIDAVWQGPCPAGMKPGDMTLPGGMKINMLDMANGAPPMGAHPSSADIARMRAQAMEMTKEMRKAQHDGQ